MKNLVLSMVGLTLCVACTSGAGVSEGGGRVPRDSVGLDESSRWKIRPASGVPESVGLTENVSAVDGASAETFLATLCEKRL